MAAQRVAVRRALRTPQGASRPSNPRWTAAPLRGGARSLPSHLSPTTLLSLQRDAGNRAVGRLLDGHHPAARGHQPPVVSRRADGCGCHAARGACSCTEPETAGPTVQRQGAQGRPSQAEETAFALANPGKVTHVGDTTGGGSGLGQTEPNEFVLWNYLVGKAELRPGHVAGIADAAKRWARLLRENPSLRLKIVGSASSSGSAAGNSSLALRRAGGLKTFLVAAGVPEAGIEVVGVGTRQPLADDRTPAGLARNRRIEVYLFRPTQVVQDLASASAEVLSEKVSVGSTFTRTLDPAGKFVALRHVRMEADARVQGSGGPGSEVGYLQFVQHDERIGRYRPAGGGNLVTFDYSRCTKPYLPCKDVAESMAVFSSPSLSLLPGPLRTEGNVNVNDAPGVAFPLTVDEPQPARLEELEWSMEFVCVLGIRKADQFMALHHFIWRVDVNHTDAAGPAPGTKQAAAVVASGVPGAPAGLDMEGAMDRQTCRFTMRRIAATGGDEIREMCQPELL